MEKPTELNTGLDWLYNRIEQLGYESLSEFARDHDLNKGNLYRYFSWETKPSVAVLPILVQYFKCDVHEVLSALGVEVPKSRGSKPSGQKSQNAK